MHAPNPLTKIKRACCFHDTADLLPPARVRLTVIIPVYNEAATIEVLIERVYATGMAHEIIAVDDGSSDGTGAILDNITRLGDIPLRVLYHPKNRGKGAAVRTALAKVTGDVVLIQDADLEYDPADYPALLAPFADPGMQAVYGSRNRARHEHSNFFFYWGGCFLSWLTNRLYHSALTDEATGYKVVATDLLRSLDLQSEGFELCPELTAKLLQRGVRIHEVPISYQPRSWEEGKKIQWHDGLRAIWTLVRLKTKPTGPQLPPRWSKP